MHGKTHLLSKAKQAHFLLLTLLAGKSALPFEDIVLRTLPPHLPLAPSPTPSPCTLTPYPPPPPSPRTLPMHPPPAPSPRTFPSPTPRTHQKTPCPCLLLRPCQPQQLQPLQQQQQHAAGSAQPPADGSNLYCMPDRLRLLYVTHDGRNADHKGLKAFNFNYSGGTQGR